MKKLMIVTLLVTLTLTSFSNAKTSFSYLLTSKGTIYCTKVKVGTFQTTYFLATGERMTLSNDQLQGYYKNETLHMKMPEIVNNKPTDNFVWMELLSTRNGQSAYMYHNYLPSGDEVDEIYIFENDRFVVKVDEKNYSTVLPYFNLQLK